MFEFDIVYDKESHVRGIMALNFNRAIICIVLSVLIFATGVTWLVFESISVSSGNYGNIGAPIVFILVAIYYAIIAGLGLSEKYLRKAIDKLLTKNSIVYPKTFHYIFHEDHIISKNVPASSMNVFKYGQVLSIYKTDLGIYLRLTGKKMIMLESEKALESDFLEYLKKKTGRRVFKVKTPILKYPETAPIETDAITEIFETTEREDVTKE